MLSKTIKCNIVLILIFFVFSIQVFAGDINKQVSFHHSVTRNGNIQVRQLIKYVKDGKVINKRYGKPMTPADPKKMDGWDETSKEIVSAIIEPSVKAEFEAEKQVMTGVGVEEIVKYDRVIKPDGRISVRRIAIIFDAGIEVSKKYHRSWVMPGDDPAEADVMTRAVARKIHTPAVVAAYRAKMKALEDR